VVFIGLVVISRFWCLRWYLNKTDFAIDFGIGFESSVKRFVFAPEIRFSYGLLNINENPVFQTLRYNNLSLILNFK